MIITIQLRGLNMTKIIDRKIEITINNNKQHLFINMRLAKLQVHSH
jgi:hypothetical protein